MALPVPKPVRKHKKWVHNLIHVLTGIVLIGSLPISGVVAPAIAAKIALAAAAANIALGQLKGPNGGR